MRTCKKLKSGWVQVFKGAVEPERCPTLLAVHGESRVWVDRITLL